MNFSRLMGKAGLFCRNVTAKPVKNADPRALLEDVWPDVRSDCYLSRPESWANPKESVDVSVIVATYNNDDTIQDSVASVLNQETSFSFELIVVNDGSTDHTAEMLAPYEACANVHILHQANTGHSGARNAGIALCRGKYILFHDGDDTLLPGALQNLLTCAKETGAEVVAGGYLCRPRSGEVYPGLHYRAGRVSDLEKIPGMTCGKLFARRLFANLVFPEKYWYEDSIVSQILLPQANFCWAIDQEVFTYFLNEAGVSFTSQGKKKAIDSLYVTESLLRQRGKYGLTLDADAYRHFLHMVLLTYHRTYQLDTDVLWAVYACQRELLRQYFPNQCAGGKYAALEKALVRGNYRRYLWECETLWIRQNLKK